MAATRTVTRTSRQVRPQEDHSQASGQRPPVRVMTAGTTGMTRAGHRSLRPGGNTLDVSEQLLIPIYFSSKPSKSSKSSKKKSESKAGGSLIDLDGSSSKKDDGWNDWDDDGW